MEASSNKDTSMEQDKTGPDYFGYYTCEVAYLLSQTEDYFDLSESNGGSISKTDSTRHIYTGKEASGSGVSSLFCNALGANISDFKKERLNALLRQSVPHLTQEVVEMEDPVIALHRIHIFKEKASTCSNAKCNDNDDNPCKKSKLCSSSMRSTNPTNCSHNVEVNDDLQAVFRTDGAKVQETMKRISDELHETLERKKQKLEELLNVIMSNCSFEVSIERFPSAIFGSIFGSCSPLLEAKDEIERTNLFGNSAILSRRMLTVRVRLVLADTGAL